MTWIGSKDSIQVAKDNVMVFKAFYKNTTNKKLYSAIRYTPYIPHKLYEVKELKPMPPSLSFPNSDTVKIDEGLHSFHMNYINEVKGPYYIGRIVRKYKVCGMCLQECHTSLWDDDTLSKIYGNFKLTLLKCIIPKGATYYINMEGKVVSTKLIVTEEEIKL